MNFEVKFVLFLLRDLEVKVRGFGGEVCEGL